VAPHRMGLMGSHSNQPLLGYLARPEGPGRHPAVVVLHGCGGFGTSYPVVAEVLKSYGYVALALGSLDEINACTGGSGDAVEAVDAYAALTWLARQNDVDPDRVAVLGFSMGGMAALDDVETGPGAIEKAEPRHFRAAIAHYPVCRYRTGMMTAPTLILIGDKDDWTFIVVPGDDGAPERQRRAGDVDRLSGSDARVQLSRPGAAISRPSPRLRSAGHGRCVAAGPQLSANDARWAAVSRQ
jgi:dienelactone hydrolase